MSYLFALFILFASALAGASTNTDRCARALSSASIEEKQTLQLIQLALRKGHLDASHLMAWHQGRLSNRQLLETMPSTVATIPLVQALRKSLAAAPGVGQSPKIAEWIGLRRMQDAVQSEAAATTKPLWRMKFEYLFKEANIGELESSTVFPTPQGTFWAGLTKVAGGPQLGRKVLLLGPLEGRPKLDQWAASVTAIMWPTVLNGIPTIVSDGYPSALIHQPGQPAKKIELPSYNKRAEEGSKAWRAVDRFVRKALAKGNEPYGSSSEIKAVSGKFAIVGQSAWRVSIGNPNAADWNELDTYLLDLETGLKVGFPIPRSFYKYRLFTDSKGHPVFLGISNFTNTNVYRLLESAEPVASYAYQQGVDKFDAIMDSADRLWIAIFNPSYRSLQIITPFTGSELKLVASGLDYSHSPDESVWRQGSDGQIRLKVDIPSQNRHGTVDGIAGFKSYQANLLTIRFDATGETGRSVLPFDGGFRSQWVDSSEGQLVFLDGHANRLVRFDDHSTVTQATGMLLYQPSSVAELSSGERMLFQGGKRASLVNLNDPNRPPHFEESRQILNVRWVKTSHGQPALIYQTTSDSHPQVGRVGLHVIQLSD